MTNAVPFLYFVEVNFRYNALPCFEASVAMQKQTDAFRGHGLSLLDEQKTTAPAVTRRKQVVEPQLVASGVFSSCFSRWSRRLSLQLTISTSCAKQTIITVYTVECRCR